jgi:hypothetical protein
MPRSITCIGKPAATILARLGIGFTLCGLGDMLQYSQKRGLSPFSDVKELKDQFVIVKN